MEICFLIGNGFDIGTGMASKFSDFFPVYTAESRDKPDNLRGLAENIDTDSDRWSYFERQIGHYTTQFSPNTKQDLIAQLDDFESSFIEYITRQERGLSYDNKQEISSKMIEALSSFCSSPNLQISSASRVKKVFEKYDQENHTYNFINFNYTPILEKCLATISNKVVLKRSSSQGDRKNSIGKIVHVHGKIDAFPIMGLNDTKQIENSELRGDNRFARDIVKPLCNEALRMNYDEEASIIINNSMIICIYGMSLGETDKKWWYTIVNWLATHSDKQLVLYVRNSNYKTSTQFGWNEIENSTIDKLTLYAKGLNVDVESLRPRIHIAINKSIFEIDLAKRNREMYEAVVEKILAKV